MAATLKGTVIWANAKMKEMASADAARLEAAVPPPNSPEQVHSSQEAVAEGAAEPEPAGAARAGAADDGMEAAADEGKEDPPEAEKTDHEDEEAAADEAEAPLERGLGSGASQPLDNLPAFEASEDIGDGPQQVDSGWRAEQMAFDAENGATRT